MPTLEAYRLRFANDLHALGPTVTGGTATGGDTNTPSTLIDTKWPVLSLVEKEDRWEGAYLLRPNAVTTTDYVRKIEGDESYRPSAGTFVTDGVYTVAPAAGSPADTAYELHLHGFEPHTELTELLNEALKEILIPVQVPYLPQTHSGGAQIQNLTNTRSATAHRALHWLLHPRWVMKIGLLPASSMPVQTVAASLVPVSGSIELGDGTETTGSLAYNASDATYQTAIRTLPGFEEAVVVNTIPTDGMVTITLPYAPLELEEITIVSSTLGTFLGGLIPVTSFWSPPVPDATPLTARLYLNGPDVLAEFDRPFADDDRLYITSLVRAYDWCRASDSVAFGTQSGLADEDDEAVPLVEWVSAQMQVQAWLRNPRLMQENLEKRRCLAFEDARRLAGAYQDAYLKGVVVDEKHLTFDVEGGPFARPAPALLAGGGA